MGQYRQGKKFGLVFEDHLPELLPLHGAKPRKGDLVCRRQGALKDVWQVKSLQAGIELHLRNLVEHGHSNQQGSGHGVWYQLK